MIKLKLREPFATEKRHQELGEAVAKIIDRWQWTPDQIRQYANKFAADRGPIVSILLDIADVRESQEEADA